MTDTVRMIIAQSARLELRPKRLEDAPNDYRWRTDPELARLDAAEPLRLPYEEFLARFADEVLGPWPDRELFAIDTRDGVHIGNVMYYNAALSMDSAEVGIVIGDRRYWGHGYGTEAMVTFVRWIWSARPWRRLVLHTLEWNERARRCFECAGFQPVAVVVRQGQRFVRMEAVRQWWLLWDQEGRFASPREGQ